jgi:hypothetical protein
MRSAALQLTEPIDLVFCTKLILDFMIWISDVSWNSCVKSSRIKDFHGPPGVRWSKPPDQGGVLSVLVPLKEKNHGRRRRV